MLLIVYHCLSTRLHSSAQSALNNPPQLIWPHIKGAIFSNPSALLRQIDRPSPLALTVTDQECDNLPADAYFTHLKKLQRACGFELCPCGRAQQ